MRQYPEKTPLTDTSEPTQHRHPLTSLAGIGGVGFIYRLVQSHGDDLYRRGRTLLL